MMKKAIFIAIPIVVLLIISGLALTGVINIPGITPKKPKKKTVTAAKTVNPKPVTPAIPPPSPPVAANLSANRKPVPTIDPVIGAKKIGAIWSEMQPAQVIEISKSYSVNNLSLIFRQMDDAQVAAILSLLPPAKSAAISKEIQSEAAVIPPETSN